MKNKTDVQERIEGLVTNDRMYMEKDETRYESTLLRLQMSGYQRHPNPAELTQLRYNLRDELNQQRPKLLKELKQQRPELRGELIQQRPKLLKELRSQQMPKLLNLETSTYDWVSGYVTRRPGGAIKFVQCDIDPANGEWHSLVGDVSAKGIYKK